MGFSGSRGGIEQHGTSIVVVQGDLTALEVDAVVNAANEQLEHGGGVALAIARAGGPEVQEESRRWVAEHGPVGRGTAAVTTAGRMQAEWAVHTVGPRYREGQDNAALLAEAVIAALDAAAATGARSVAMPAISAGIFGYPRRQATGVIAAAVATWVDANPDRLTEVALVGYDAETADDFTAAVEAIHPAS
jgi:O-acetyl-ADP-ribose deacetylase (regulator of RNase III)